MKLLKFELGIRCDFLIAMTQGESQVLENYFIGVNNTKIVFIGKWKSDFKKKSKKFLHAKNQLVLPGFVNGHTHLAMTLFRGIEDDVPFSVWLFERILPLERKLVDSDFVKVGTELAALECLRFGTTTVNDQYFFSKTAAQVWDKSGLRGLFAQVFSDFPLPEDRQLGRDKKKLFLDLLKKYKDHPRITPALGPHAPYSCNDEVLGLVAQLSQEHHAPVHIHVSETQKEVEDHVQKYGTTPVERLQKLGLLQKKSIFAHGVYLSETDQDLIAQSGTKIIHNPDSNLKLSSGIAPIANYLKKMITVGLGTDGSASCNSLNMIHAMNLATKIQKVSQKDNMAMTAPQALYMATLGGAKTLGLDSKIGSLEVGKHADMIFIDLNHPHLQPPHDLVSHLVYSASGLEIDTVLCDGKLLMKNKKFLTLNEQQIYKKVQVYYKKIQRQLRELKNSSTK